MSKGGDNAVTEIFPEKIWKIDFLLKIRSGNFPEKSEKLKVTPISEKKILGKNLKIWKKTKNPF